VSWKVLIEPGLAAEFGSRFGATCRRSEWPHVCHMRPLLILAAVVIATGCLGPGYYGRAALRHEEGADARSQLGDPIGAARELEKAENLRAAARLTADQYHGRFWSELTLK
jgi:hypothetical protein